MAIIPPWNPNPNATSDPALDPVLQPLPASTTESYPLPNTNPHPLLAQPSIESLEHQFHAIGITDPQAVVPMWLGKRNHYDSKLLEDAEDVLAYFQRQKADADAVQITPQAMVEDMEAQVREQVQEQKLAKALERDARRTSRAEALAEIESAGAAWRKAVADRRALMIQWDTYVSHLHDRVKTLKAALKKA